MPTCDYCAKPFVSRHPSQRFCPKRKTGRHLCKDRYHNRERFRADNISDARRQYMGVGRSEGGFQVSGGWDDHKDALHTAFPFGSEADIGEW